MKDNPLLKLRAFGQSIWMDYISRHVINSGELRQLIEGDGLCGVTSNPSIFDKAIAGSHDYDDAIRVLAFAGRNIEEIYRELTVEDVQTAADLFRPTYDRLEGGDGFVSLEVNPHLAHDTRGTIAEARQLWAALNRPNVFIKVPATLEGLPAIRQLISEGVNVNVTLLFGLPRYREVAEAYIAGLEDRAAGGLPVKGMASVASFFLSRIDVLIDPLFEKIMASGGPEAATAARLHGQIAVASAKMAYQIYKGIFDSERFQRLAAQGARPQRVLWASTSTKNPEYPDVKYVEPLIGPDTINTLPPETINAYRDHGDPAPRLEEHLDEAADFLKRLPELNIDLDKITRQLEDEGVAKFNEPYDSLMRTLAEKCKAACSADP
ncbi:MAG: transaldolase [Syntrophobacteraceae bacterium]|jgi:transaldolase